MARPPPALFYLLSSVVTLGLLVELSGAITDNEWGGIQNAPSESECRPYIEKALKELSSSDSQEDTEASKGVEEISSSNEDEQKQNDNNRIEHGNEKSEDSKEINEGQTISDEIHTHSGEEGEDEVIQDYKENNASTPMEEEEVEPSAQDDSISDETFAEVTIRTREETETIVEDNLNKILAHDEKDAKTEVTQEGNVNIQEGEMNSVEEASHESGEDNSANVAGQSGSTEEEIRLQNENEEITQISSGSEESMENREEDEPKSDYSEELNEKLEEVKTNLDHESDQLKDKISEEESSEDKIIKEIENESNEEEGGNTIENEGAIEEQPQEEKIPVTQLSSEDLSTDDISSDENVNKEIQSEESTPEVEAITTYGEIDPKTESEERKIAEESSAEQEIQSNFKKESEERKIVEELSVEQKIQTNTKKESEEIVTNESFKEEGSLKGETQSQEEERPTEGASAEENRHDEGISRETEASTMGGMSKEIKREAEEDEKDKEAGRDAYEEEQDKVEEEKEFKVEEGEKMEEKEKQAMVEGAASENKVILKEMEPEEEDLTMSSEIPDKLRLRDHISEILKLDDESVEIENLMRKTVDTILKELKKLYETAIKPLEILYKYRDLSNRHFGDSEIFSKPLILFMGPWSGGKSTIINYLLNNEFKKTALRTGAEPSPAYFNIVMWGEREEVLDGTQLAADWTFSGLQKFGQGLLDRLKGHKLNHPLLAKVNIVEIPGILEIRKQVERMFPFNDACQWFIDRADIIFLVYDPSKLDVGPETEAILDQLKGREYQTRIILNKADQVKPEELMRVQGTLIWNISPLMSSTEPPVMYSTSLWSVPYQSGSPTRLLYAQEKAFLKDLKEAIDKRVENKIASARRFAVRVRNHAKMVDCYLTTYYNHKTFFGNKKKVSDDIIEHPQNYHIYEGLSTLTNISRYDLPDPDVYKDFFRLNPVYDFQQLSSTCTYFRGCPINRLDVAIAYDLPELVGKYKTSAEEVLEAAIKKTPENS